MNQGESLGRLAPYIGDLKKNVENWSFTMYNRNNDCREVKA